MREKRTANGEEGMIFAWRASSTSAMRWLIALVVSGGFWFLMISFLKVEIKAKVTVPADSMSLTVIDLNYEENQWLADIVERESPLANRWAGYDDFEAKRWMEEVVRSELPAPYRASFPEVVITPEPVKMTPYEEFFDWREPDAERVKGRKVDAVKPGGLKVVAVDNEWGGMVLRWGSENGQVTVGDVYEFQLGLSSEGQVVHCQSIGESLVGEEISGILAGYRFPADYEVEGIRWWQLRVEVMGGES